MIWNFLQRYRQQRQLRRIKQVGRGLVCAPSAQLYYPDQLTLGDYVYLGPHVHLHAQGGLTIHDHVILAPEVAILTVLHRYEGAEMVPYDQMDLLRPVTIERCVWIGMRAMIMPGVTLGEGCIVGAGAVVTKSFPPGAIIAGNPARVIKERDMDHYQRCVEGDQFYLKRKQLDGLQKVHQQDLRS